MPAQNIHVIAEPFKTLEEASEAFAVLQKQVRYLQEHIDVENIISKSLTAEVIAANAITANEIKAGAVTADKIVAGSVTPDKMTVDQLSSIADDLGLIIAGVIKSIQIFGSYIATSETYPRTEMDVTGNFLAAISVPGTYLAITPQGFGNVPSVSLVVGNSIKGFLNRSVGGTSLGSFDGENLNLQAGGTLVLNPLGNLQIGGSAGVSGTVFVSSTPGGPANTAITFTKGIRTG